MTQLQKFLKEKRTQAGYSQLQVSKKLGYESSQFISNWERGISHPPIQKMKEIAKMYDCDLTELYNLVVTQAMNNVRDRMNDEFKEIK